MTNELFGDNIASDIALCDNQRAMAIRSSLSPPQRMPQLFHNACEGEENKYPDGNSHADLIFDKSYLIESITARDSHVVITLKENIQINTLTWATEKVSFS